MLNIEKKKILETERLVMMLAEGVTQGDPLHGHDNVWSGAPPPYPEARSGCLGRMGPVVVCGRWPSSCMVIKLHKLREWWDMLLIKGRTEVWVLPSGRQNVLGW